MAEPSKTEHSTPESPTTLGELDAPGWLFATPRRRRRMVAGLCAVVLAVGLWNLPVPGWRPAYRDVVRVPYELVRLDQNWSYFSPEVGLTSPEVWVEVERTSGGVERWDFPDEFPVFGTFRSYRWIKYDEAVLAHPEDWDQILAYVANDVDAPETIAEVRLIIAITAPTEGDHGPYDPDYTIETVRTRVP